MSDVEIKVENIVASATLGKSLELPKIAPALENVEYNLEQFPGLVFKLKDPKTAALIFGSGKLVCTGAKCIEDSIKAIHMTVDKIRELDTENTEYEPEQFPGLVYRLSDPKVVLLLFGSGKVVCTGAKTADQALLGVQKTKERLIELYLIEE